MQYYQHNALFNLEAGGSIKDLRIAYSTFGKLNRKNDNVVWVFHALTANSNPFEWWPGLFGEDDLFNPGDYYIVCANVLGSCYGSTGPSEERFKTGGEDGRFPLVTVRDVVKAHGLLQKYLNLPKIKVAIGGSFGGYQAIEMAFNNPHVENLILIATGAVENPWNIAIHEAQRQALRADEGNGGEKGLAAARAIGMLMYRTPQLFNSTQARLPDQIREFRASSYISYQGEKLVERFDKDTYFHLTECLDTHDLGRGRGGIEVALKGIFARTLLIGIKEDQIALEQDMQEMASHIIDSEFVGFNSRYGHDGFLVETEKITKIIKGFLILS